MLVQSKQDVAKFQLVILFEHETVSLMKKIGNVANNVQLNDKHKVWRKNSKFNILLKI